MSNKVQRIKTKAQAAETKTTPVEAKEDVSSLLPQGDLKNLSSEALGMTQIEASFYRKYKVEIKDAPKAIGVIHERMLKYTQDMGVNVPIHSGEQGAQNQLYLYQTFLRALGLTGNELFMGVDLVTAHIRDGLNTTFADRMVYRFVKYIRRDQDEVNSYLKLLEIFLLISDPAKRNEVVTRGTVRATVAAIDPRFKEAVFNLVTYLSQENI